jgi:hypothetical protein
MSEVLVVGIDSLPLSALGSVHAPARLNAAGFCCCCLTRWCADARCIDSHMSVSWGVCMACEGEEWVGVVDQKHPCGCWSGMVTEDEDARGVLDGLLYAPVLSQADADLLAAGSVTVLRAVSDSGR